VAISPARLSRRERLQWSRLNVGLAMPAMLALSACSDPSASPSNVVAASTDASTSDAEAGAFDAPFDSGFLDGSVDAGPTCPPGSTLVADRSSCPGALVVAPSMLSNASAAATRGDVITLGGLNPSTVPCLPVVVCAPLDAPTMLFSDEPELPVADGVLYADVVGPGRFRVYVYHANGGAALRKFPVVVLNQGSSDAHVTVGARGIAGPSTNYISVGKSAASSWLGSTAATSLTVPPMTRILLDTTLDTLFAQQNDLVHAIIDFRVDAPVKVSVLSLLSTEATVATAAGLSLLANTGAHTRGTFPNAERIVTTLAPFDASTVRKLTLGDGIVDLDLAGIDAVDGNAAVKLGGNYGLVYRMSLDARMSTAFALAPRGGAWGGAAELSAGSDAPKGVTSLPSAVEALGATTQAVAAGRFGAGKIGLRLISGGGSSLPVEFLSIPLP
jgi:hypothetical protein